MKSRIIKNIRIGVAETTTPSLDGDDGVALLQDVESKSVVNTPLEALVNILLPDDLIEIRLRLRIVERIHATVQMGKAGGSGIAGNHDDGAARAVLGQKASSQTTN